MRYLESFAIALAVLPAGLASSATAQSIDVPKFEAVELTGGGGEVILRHGKSQRVTLVSGSTSITRFEVPPPSVRRVGNTTTHDGGDTLIINACNGDCPRGYRPKIEITSPHISGIAAKSGGKVVAEGEFPSQSSLGVAAMGGGEIDVRAMAARSVGAHASGGGIVRTRPLANLGAYASAGGRILYSGDPKIGMQVATGGSVARAH
jgi:hypothetical protein